MAFGLGVLKLSSRDFWRMTPREFARAIAPFAPARAVPIGRASLARLMQQFPDQSILRSGGTTPSKKDAPDSKG